MDITRPTVRLFVPKFDAVVTVNADEEAQFRTQYGARGEHEPAPEPSKPKPFLTKAEKAAAEKAAADAAAAEKAAADAAASGSSTGSSE